MNEIAANSSGANEGTPKFSIVVPMYNVERYVGECIESLRVQTLQDIEIILVDDGSPDRCGDIAEDYAAMDSRIRVVHRENGGLGPARNSGMEVAQGEYVGFVDSDDCVDPDMFERLYRSLASTDSDIAFTGMRCVTEGEVVEMRVHPFAGRVLEGRDEIFELRRSFYGACPARVKDDPTPLSVCLAGYSKRFLEENHLRFRNIRSEDKFFNTEACRVAKRVACIGGTPYCYRKDGQPSITKTFNRKTIDSFFDLFRALESMALEEPDAYRGECMLRTKRCVIDYCRVLVRMIEESSEGEREKRAFVAEVAGHPVSRAACCAYPFWRLPPAQQAFFLALRTRSVKLMRLLIMARRGIS